jgi:hypothetical protein
MSNQVVDDETPHVGRSSGGGGLNARPMLEEAVDENGNTVRRGRALGRSIEDEDVHDLAPGVKIRKFKPSLEKLFEDLDKGRAEGDGDEGDPDAMPDEEHVVDDEVDPDATEADAQEVAPDEAQQQVGQAAAQKPAPKQPQANVDLDKIRTERDSVLAHNRALAAENQQLRSRPAPKFEPPAHVKALEEAVEIYDRDPTTSIKRFLAVVLDAAHDSKEVDEELSGVYGDLTAKEIGVPLEQAAKANRNATLARLALARDKKSRQVQPAESAPNPENGVGSQQVAEANAKYIRENFLDAKQGDKPTVAERYPLMNAMSEEFDGMKPEELLWQVLKSEKDAGNPFFTSPRKEDELVEFAAKRVEDHYSGIIERASKARKQPDTAKPNNAQAASNEQRQQTGARTINNARASQAPASPPAETNPTQNNGRRLTKQEKLNKLLDRHFPSPKRR